MQLMPEEVILAIALVDLPIDIDDKDGIKVQEGHGESWSFLCVDSDDHMINIVEEIVSICSFQQMQELCFMKYDGSGSTIVDRATPKCREVLNRALRFLGRFEFVGDGPLFSDMQTGFKAFDALDFGRDDDEEGKRVLLECYRNEFDFENRVSESSGLKWYLILSSSVSLQCDNCAFLTRSIVFTFRCILCSMWN